MGSSSLGFYERHELKVLNVGLLLYLCLGALLFDWLGEFEGGQRHLAGSAPPAKRGGDKTASLESLRLEAARRMWNITNQLNILYESNWTNLVLEELADFERHFLDSLVARNSELEEDLEDADAEEEEKVEEDREKEEEKEKKEKKTDTEKEKERRRAQDNKRGRRGRSIRKSLIHSVATITTIGSPSGQPRTQAGKLATVLYGALGIPLLVVAVSQTGRRLARHSLNLLLLARHYCFRLPVHYLCCSCQLGACFRWLAWCCCCCCCSQLCCFSLKPHKKKSDRSRKPPALRLQQWPARPTGGARPAAKGPQAPMANGGGGHHPLTIKSVRFQHHQPPHHEEISEDQDEISQKSGSETAESSGFTSSTFAMSLMLLAVYLAVGAYAYARHYQAPLIDGLIASYDLITGSKLPDSLGVAAASDPRRMDPAGVYELLKSSQKGRLNKTPQPTTETLLWHLLYLVGGLNLISMCGHYARLWLNGDLARHLGDCLVQRGSIGGQPPNGGDKHLANGLFKHQSPQDPAHEKPDDAVHGFYGAAHGSQQQLAGSQQAPPAAGFLEPSNLVLQHPQQIGLAELFVVGDQQQQQRRPEVVDCNGRQQQQVASDLSFASTDRSTDRASLCLHHQQQHQQHQQLAGSLHSNSPAGSGATLYGGHHLYATSVHQQPLYLASSLVDNNNNHEEEDEEEEEMERMLKSCMRPTVTTTNGYETNDTTATSSSTASRPLKLRHQHHHHQVAGFLLDPLTGEARRADA